jgi:hypothetical protein
MARSMKNGSAPIFELFVAEWLRANAPPGMTVRCQHNAALDSNLEMKIHIDIVLCDENSQRPLAILDTKYKAGEQPSEEDIFSNRILCARAPGQSCHARLSIDADLRPPHVSWEEHSCRESRL